MLRTTQGAPLIAQDYCDHIKMPSVGRLSRCFQSGLNPCELTRIILAEMRELSVPRNLITQGIFRRWLAIAEAIDRIGVCQQVLSLSSSECCILACIYSIKLIGILQQSGSLSKWVCEKPIGAQA